MALLEQNFVSMSEVLEIPEQKEKIMMMRFVEDQKRKDCSEGMLKV